MISSINSISTKGKNESSPIWLSRFDIAHMSGYLQSWWHLFLFGFGRRRWIFFAENCVLIGFELGDVGHKIVEMISTFVSIFPCEMFRRLQTSSGLDLIPPPPLNEKTLITINLMSATSGVGAAMRVFHKNFVMQINLFRFQIIPNLHLSINSITLTY